MPRRTSHLFAKVRYACHLALLVSIVIFSSRSINAQDTVTGAFQGTVTDSQSGAVLKDAVVEIINQQTNVTITQKTDYQGRFFQGLLLPGTYIVRVSMGGYATKAVLQVLRITYAGEVVPVPVALDPVPPGSTQPDPTSVTPAAVEENDIRASIITVDGRRSGSYVEDEIVALPLGAITSTRSFDELALLLPGVAPPPQTLGSVAGPGVGAGVGSAGQFSVNGLRSRANNFTVDGSDNNDEDIGVRRQGFVALTPQPVESIREYQLITLLAPAQFGRNIGGQVNAVSRSGGKEHHGTIYGFFNSSQLNARNFFDTTFGNGVSVLQANQQDVVIQTRTFAGQLISQEPLTVRNESGNEDSFTLGQFGFVVGGPVVQNNLFYFASFERKIVNATEEQSFAVPSLVQRGAFGTGETGLFQNPFTGARTSTIPMSINGGAIFSLYPFANNPSGVYGINTLTRVLPASERGTILSGKLDHNFRLNQREQSVTGRYNFTNDWRDIPTTGGAIFSTLRPRIQTNNFSFFYNSQINSPDDYRPLFNQLRLSYGRTKLNFEEVRDQEFLIPSVAFPTTPFLLNAREIVNVTVPNAPGVPNTGPVIFLRQPVTVEEEIGPIGQVVVAGFSPLGVDTFTFPQRRVNNTYQIADQLSTRIGDHNFTFGTDNRRTELNSELPRNARPYLTFGGAPRLIFNGDVPRFPTAADPNPIIRPEDLAAIDAPNNLFLTLSTGQPDAIGLRFYQLNFFAQDEWRVRRNLSLSLGLRYEYNTPPREGHELIESTFDSPMQDLAPGLRTFLEGRTRIYDPDRNNLAPRFGIAYLSNALGNNRVTVVRGGYGIFYDQSLGAVISQSRNVFPSFFTLNFGGGPFTSINNEFLLVIFNPVTTTFGNLLIPIVSPGSLNRLNPQLPISTFLPALQTFFPNAISPTIPRREFEMPMAQHYGVTIEQQLQRSLVLSLAYVGTSGKNLLRFTTPNLGPGLNIAPTQFAVQQLQLPFPTFNGRVSSPARPVSGVGGIQIFETTANSRFHSLQIQLRGRFTNAFQFQSSYSFSKALDDVSDVFDLAGASALPQNSVTFEDEWAPASFDVRHRLVFDFIYNVPASKQAIVKLFRGFQVAGSGRFYSGQPFTVNSIIDVNQDGNLTDRLNTVDGLLVTDNGEQPLILNTTNTLSLLASFGQDGQIPRNSFRAGATAIFDLSVSRKFSLGGARNLVLRADFFNLPNRTNFGVPVRFLEAAGFGRAVNTITPARRVQLSVKMSF